MRSKGNFYIQTVDQKPEEEISIETIKKLPKMYFTNITGGEPFIRTDLKDIVRELYKKSDRIVISTNGFFTDRIVDLCKEFPQIGSCPTADTPLWTLNTKRNSPSLPLKSLLWKRLSRAMRSTKRMLIVLSL